MPTGCAAVEHRQVAEAAVDHHRRRPARSTPPTSTVSGSRVIQARDVRPLDAAGRHGAQHVALGEDPGDVLAVRDTSAAPTPRSFIRAAASRQRPSPARRSAGSRDITSPTVVISVSQLGPPRSTYAFSSAFSSGVDRAAPRTPRASCFQISVARAAVSLPPFAVPALVVLGRRERAAGRSTRGSARACARRRGSGRPAPTSWCAEKASVSSLISSGLNTVVQHPQDLDVDDELLVAGDERPTRASRRSA